LLPPIAINVYLFDNIVSFFESLLAKVTDNEPIEIQAPHSNRIGNARGVIVGVRHNREIWSGKKMPSQLM